MGDSNMEITGRGGRNGIGKGRTGIEKRKKFVPCGYDQTCDR
jgi:hypothetical protein